MKIVAEAGTSYEGSLDKAKKLVETAKNCGADVVKFQWVYADEILHPKTGFVDLPGGKIALYDRFKQLEVTPDFFYELRQFCRENEIAFMCSPFGPKSLSELLQIEPDFIKIASPELNYVQLLRQLANENKKNIPVVLSTGVSKLCDIERALDILKKTDSIKEPTSSGKLDMCGELDSCGTPNLSKNLDMCKESIAQNDNITLLHCITSYPAPEEEYNLRLICSLQNIFGFPTGVSDHSLSPLYVPLLSQALGATMLEKHITLSNEGCGLDDPVALNPKNFELMCSKVREFAKADSVTDYTLSWLQDKIGDKVSKILGNGVKKLAPSEEKNYGRTNRSLRFVKDKKHGQIIENGDIAVLRTEKILDVGVEPKFLDNFIGCKLTKDVQSSDAVTWSCISHHSSEASFLNMH